LEDHCRLYRVLIKLSQEINRLPSNLFIKVHDVGVQVDGGGFGDIYRGTFRGEVVGLKSFRHFGGTAEEKNGFRKVFLLLSYHGDSTANVPELDLLSRGAGVETAQSSAYPPFSRHRRRISGFASLYRIPVDVER
jgi:hypothetical protein